MNAIKYLLDIGFDDAHLPDLFNNDDKSYYKIPELMEAYHQAKVAHSKTQVLFTHGIVKRDSYNKYRGWDVFGKKVVKYAYIEEDGAVMRANGMCVGNYLAEDFLLSVP